MPTGYIKKKKKSKEKEDKSFVKVLAAFAATVVVEVFALIVYRSFYESKEMGIGVPFATIKWIFAALFLVLAAAAAYFYIKKKPSQGRWLVEGAVLMLLLSASCFFLSHYGLDAAKLLCILFPAAMVLYIFMLLYQREFFICALLCAGAIITAAIMKAHNSHYNMMTLSAGIATAVLAVIFAVLALAAGKDGRLKLGRRRPAVFEMRGGRAVILISCVLAAAVTAISLARVEPLYEVCIYVTAAFLFVSAVYHTAKLM